MHTLLIGQAGHGAAEERLGGIGHPVPPGPDGRPAGLAQVVLVVDEQRRPELGGQVEQVDISHAEMPVLAHGGRPGQQFPLDGVGGDGVLGGHGQAGYGRLHRARDGITVRDEYDRPLLLPP